MLNPTRGVSGPVWDSALPFPVLKVTWELISHSVTVSRSRTLPLDSLLLFSELEFQATTQWQPLWPLSPCCSEASSLVAFEFLFLTLYDPQSAISWCYLHLKATNLFVSSSLLFLISKITFAYLFRGWGRLSFSRWTWTSPHGRSWHLFLCPQWVFWDIPVAWCGIILFISRHSVDNRICSPKIARS